MKVSVFLTAIILTAMSFCSTANAATTPASLSESVQALKMTTSRSKPGILSFSVPDSAQKVQFTVYNAAGAVVLSEERAASDLQIDIKKLKSEGIYTFTAVANGKKYSSKAVIML